MELVPGIDQNDDGIPDLVSLDPTRGRVVVIAARGDGTFLPALSREARGEQRVSGARSGEAAIHHPGERLDVCAPQVLLARSNSLL